jgi:hypothetical protein
VRDNYHRRSGQQLFSQTLCELTTEVAAIATELIDHSLVEFGHWVRHVFLLFVTTREFKSIGTARCVSELHFQLLVSPLEPNRLNVFFDPLPHPLGEFFSARTSFQLFVAVDLSLQSFHPVFVLFDPITPPAHALGASFRVELIAPQPKKLLGLFPLGPALFAVFSRHDPGAEGRADQLGYGIESVPAVLHPIERLSEKRICRRKFR